MKCVIIQPWFSAVGHPAQSIINLAKIIGENTQINYLIATIPGNSAIEHASNTLRRLGTVIDYPVKSPSIREGTIKALITLRKLFREKKSIHNVFFLDAHLVLLSVLWPLFATKNIKCLSVVYLMGPERVTRFMFIQLLIGRFLKRKEVVLFLRTEELVVDWKKVFPNVHIKCLPTLEIPYDEKLKVENTVSSQIVRLGVLGQVRTGKSLEWLVPIFQSNPLLGELTIAGAFSQPVDDELRALLKDFNGFQEVYLQEPELLKISSNQDYLLMLYNNWDARMEGAVMFLAARVNKPVIVYDKGWCGRMVNTYNNGLLAPNDPNLFTHFVQSLPKNNTSEYQKLLKGVEAFRQAHSGNAVREAFLNVILA